jgi:hypothetical protein
VDKVAVAFTLAQPVQDILCPAHGSIHIGVCFIAYGSDLPASSNKSAHQRQAVYNLGIVFNVDRGGQYRDQVAEISQAADFLQLALPGQLLSHADLVYDLVSVIERQAGTVKPLVLLTVEGLGLEEDAYLDNGLRVNKKGADYRLFRLNVVRR